MTDKPERKSKKPPRRPPFYGPNRIGRYDVIYPIAQGGMASVYAGRLAGPAGFEKLVAIKVIHPHLSTESSFVNMFLDEARLAARIHHPNVGEIFEVGEDDGLFFMVGELIQGQSAQAFYRRAKSLGIDISQPIAAGVVSKVAHGLQAAHDLRDLNGNPLGLVHRDISPRNIVISYSGFVKLIDFGVAWAQTRLSHTDDGTIKGKVGYMPPEQIRGKKLDRRSDLFSLGVVLYLLATGNHPFPGVSEAERMHRILHGKFTAPRKANPALSAQLEEIILTAMATSPDERYESASQLAADLDRFAKVTGENIGSEELSVLMRLLFAEELAKNESRLREYRSLFGAGDDSTSWSTPPAPTGSRAGNSDARGPRKKGLRKRLYGIAGLVFSAAVVAVSAVSLRATPPEKGRQEAVLPSKKTDVDAHDAGFGTATGPDGLVLAADEKKPAFNDTEPLQGTASLEDSQAFQETSSTESVRIRLRIRPRNHRIRLNGELLPRRPRFLHLPGDGGSHTLEIYATGYITKSFEFIADKDKTLKIRLRPHPSKKPKRKSSDKKGGLKKSPYE